MPKKRPARIGQRNKRNRAQNRLYPTNPTNKGGEEVTASAQPDTVTVTPRPRRSVQEVSPCYLEPEEEETVEEIPPPEPLFSEQVLNTVVNKLKSKRMAIAYLFVYVHHAPPRESWSNKGGVAGKIKSALQICPRTCIKQDLEDIMRCIEQGIEYDPSERAGKKGRKPLIQPGSDEETMIKNLVQSGCSIDRTAQLLNADLQKKHDEGNAPLVQYTVSAVYTCIRRLAEYQRPSTTSGSEESS